MAELKYYDAGSGTWKTVSVQTPPEVFIGAAAPTRDQQVLWVDIDESPPAVARDINMDAVHFIGAAGEPAFQGAWVNYDNSLPSPTAGQRNMRFRKFPDGRVQINGICKSGASASLIFTLPPGFRPPVNLAAICNTANGMIGTSIYADGSVYAPSAYGAHCFFDGIEFDTESVLQTTSTVAQPMEPWHTVGAVGEPAFQNSWVNYETVQYNAAAFRKYPDGRVLLKGLVKNGTVSGVIFTLPIGYRPTKELLFAPGNNANTTTDLRVRPDGTVYLGSGLNTWLSLDGVIFDTETVSAYVAGSLGPQRVTALPGNPADGQECYFVADATNGVLWRLRYNAASASAYKWEVVGGNALFARGGGNGPINTAVWQTTNIPSIVTPLAGDYEIDFGGWGQNWSVGAIQSVEFAVFIAGTMITASAGNPAIWPVHATYANEGYQYGGATVGMRFRQAAITLGQTIDVRYHNTGSQNVYATNIHLRMMPVRVG